MIGSVQYLFDFLCVATSACSTDSAKQCKGIP